MKKLALLLASFTLAILVGACGGGGGSPADYPADFKVVGADSSAVVSWTAEPGVEYWIFYGPGSGITTTNWVTSGGQVAAKVTSPQVITGLVNGNTYSFTINGRKDGGPGGEGAPTQVVVPAVAGANWTVGTPLGTGALKGIAAGTSTSGYSSVIVGSGGKIFTSIRLGELTAQTNPTAPTDLDAVWYSAAGFVAAGANGTTLHSTDATTWTPQASGTTAHLHGLTSVTQGLYVAMGQGGTIVTSTNGTDWTVAARATTNDLYAGTFGNSLFVVVGANGTIHTSQDAATWTPVVSGTTNDLRGASFAVLSSTTGNTTNVTTLFVVVGAAGTVLTSTNGSTWTAQAALSTKDLTAIVYGGQFVAVGKGGVIFTSPDGVTWQARNSGTTSDLNAVTRTLTGYSAVGEAGTNVSTF